MTNDLLFVVDPNNLISPADTSKVASVALLPDLAMRSLAWDSSGGVDFSYTISGANLTHPATVDLYWSPVLTFDPTNLGQYTTAYSTTTQTDQTPSGTYVPVQVTPTQFLTQPPQGTVSLMAVINPPGPNHIPGGHGGGMGRVAPGITPWSSHRSGRAR